MGSWVLLGARAVSLGGEGDGDMIRNTYLVSVPVPSTGLLKPLEYPGR